jgi:hypothetical protein
VGNAILPYLARSQTDCALVANIFHVKVCDAMVTLFEPRGRRTPQLPIRLSFSEGASVSGAEVNWDDVSFDEGATDGPLELVFAGRRTFDTFRQRIVPFYLENRGARAGERITGPRLDALRAVLKRLLDSGVGLPTPTKSA